jgi:serine-type D-Ala-D-Ala carboxypeptidase/endopeptidase (penicillin-binding protein 4)
VRGRTSAIALAGLACVALAAPDIGAASISRARLRHGLANQMHRVGGASGAFVTDLGPSGRRTLFSDAARAHRILASNSKLFSMSAVLDRFGADGTLKTALYPRPAGGVQGHVLNGSLVLVGAGDPALASSSFARRNGLPLTPLGKLASAVHKEGIRKVTGDIRADDTVFDRLRTVPTAGVDASGELGPLSGLSYDSGISNGHYAGAPELVAARALKAKLRHEGVQVKGRIGRADLSQTRLSRPPLANVASPPMRTLLAATLKPSNNFFAEMLTKRLAAHGGTQGTTRRGVHRVRRFARKLGTGVRMEDGSGLSRRNRASPKQVARLLVAMSHRADGPVLRDSLPAAGRDGTLAHRMNGTAAAGRCDAKTGTLIGVSALSGYCDAGHGLVVFSFLMNSVNVSIAQSAQDKMTQLIARYRR